MLGLVGALALTCGACSTSAKQQDYQEGAVKLISKTLQDQIGMGKLDVTCDQPPSKATGSTFTCQGTTSDNRTVRFKATIQADKKVFVNTVNVLTKANLDTIEEQAAKILSDKVHQTLPATAIDCGNQPILAEAHTPFVCALTDPESGAVYDASITLDSVETPKELDVTVAATPRRATPSTTAAG